jgi:hypothetical protein
MCSDGFKDTMSEVKTKAKAKEATFVVKANTEDLILA